MLALRLSFLAGLSDGLFDSVGGNRDHDLFSSTDSIKKLFDEEKEMHRKLKAYLEHTSRKLRALDDLIENHYEVSDEC